MLREAAKSQTNLCITSYEDTRDMVVLAIDVEGDEFDDEWSAMQYHRGTPC